MKQKMEVASPFHLYAVINDQISQKDHCYVTPMTNKSINNVSRDQRKTRESSVPYSKTLTLFVMEKYSFLVKKGEKQMQ